MKKKSPSRSGFFNSRTLMVLFLCAATACLILIPITSGHPHAPSNASREKLTFQERIAYQRAIEEVYCRHRILPPHPNDPNPSVAKVTLAIAYCLTRPLATTRLVQTFQGLQNGNKQASEWTASQKVSQTPFIKYSLPITAKPLPPKGTSNDDTWTFPTTANSPEN